MKTKILIVLIVLIGLGAGGFFVYKNLPQPEIEKPEVKEKIEITPEIKEKTEEEIPSEKEITAPPKEKVEVPKEEKVIPPKEKLDCPHECCLDEQYQTKICPTGFQCKGNECIKELKFKWRIDSGIRISDGSVPYIYKQKDGRFRLRRLQNPIFWCKIRV
jgi:hypothetical protein